MSIYLEYIKTDYVQLLIDFTHKMELREPMPTTLQECCQQIPGVDYLGC